MKPVFRYEDGVWPNAAALAFTVLGWPAGIALLGQASGWLNALGVLLVAQTLVWSAYFIHEFAHHAIFRTPQANERWGTLMSWINGSCYASFADLRRKHMRHHVERADVITFDAQAFLRAHPLVRRTVLALEWAYIPAVEFVMRGYVIALPFISEKKKAARTRVVATALVRLAAIVALGMWSLKALLLYALAFLIFVTVLRFADCFQHTYDAYPILDDTPIPQDKVRDRVYEQANTFSDVVSLDAKWLNLVWLNFGFHNAHHERPTAPWYRLPAFHRELYPDDYAQVVTVRELLRSFHINRVKRVLASNYGVVQPPGTPGRADGFLGAVGVSFLTAV
ncbi:MAG: fatty acid desaturase family protein [Hydrogenophaga sp.]|jgi:fatty acid desaturase|uniref:fatty acid desaturase family protein n=1 Tax=Hydrogenophaga sp. TaxID=1904254 RepID=UPI001D3A850F|nr:fatty acid desaturase [Hydrogenophaga sp.]MBW0172744.1 fatty acid desaturase [Hydrogenophaga sp.]MBW0184982.1 fatty acid desaturase [Hydrogenophaga sp.]